LRGYYSLANIKKLEIKISDENSSLPLDGHFYYAQIGVSYIF